MNTKLYRRPAVQRLDKHKSWIYVQDNAPSHRSNLVQDFLSETLKSYFIKWPP